MKEEKKLSGYIDQLNKEQMPKEHRKLTKNEEREKLMNTVRRVKGIREPVMPEGDFEEKLIASLKTKKQDVPKKHLPPYVLKRTILTISAAAAAAVIFLAVPSLSFPGKQVNIVQAMEKAMDDVRAYHGIMEVVETNELGETITQARREVWADQKGNYRIDELEGYSKGLTTVNNQDKRWQIRPEDEKAYLFSAFPDPFRLTFELGSEVDEVSDALSVKQIGEERITGRNTQILEVTPDGGQSYHLWIDKETKLPLQRQSAMQNAIQIKVTYSDIEFIEELPRELLSYKLPDGFEEVDVNPEQLVTSLEEASVLAGFSPKLPEEIAEGFYLKQIAVQTERDTVKLVYQTMDTEEMVVILQGKASDDFEPDAQAILGSIGDQPVEILSNYEGSSGTNSIRWQEEGWEYTIYGNMSVERLLGFTKGIATGELAIPSGENKLEIPLFEVPVDLTVEENDQKSVDAGHSPWRLDPVFVAQVFVNVLISPEGITGEYEIPYEDIKIIHNDGIEAIAEINNDKSIAGKVYMKRLIRQDETGIWTVTGYDPISR